MQHQSEEPDVTHTTRKTIFGNTKPVDVWGTRDWYGRYDDYFCNRCLERKRVTQPIYCRPMLFPYPPTMLDYIDVIAIDIFEFKRIFFPKDEAWCYTIDDRSGVVSFDSIVKVDNDGPDVTEFTVDNPPTEG